MKPAIKATGEGILPAFLRRLADDEQITASVKLQFLDDERVEPTVHLVWEHNKLIRTQNPHSPAYSLGRSMSHRLGLSLE